MGETFTKLTQETSHTLNTMWKKMPDAMQVFSALAKAAMAFGVMSALG